MGRLLIFATALAWAVGCGSAGDVQTPKPAPRGGPSVIPGPAPGGTPDPGEDSPGKITDEDCESVQGEPLPDGQWLSGKLTCGDTVVGHTGGTGKALFDTKFYEKHFCTPATTKHDGPNERAYRIHVPEGDKTVNIKLDTPCADLDLAAVKYSGSEPPTVASNIGQCEMNIKAGTKSESVRLSSQKETDWVVIVEGKNGEDGAFALTVECHDGLY